MTDPYRWRRRAMSVAAGGVAMALLWPCAALVRGTTAHDWYAAVKLTVTEAMIAAGFNSYQVTRYRAANGTSFRITRGGLVLYGEPAEARDRILYTAAVGALHGALAGALCVVLCFMLWRVVHGWRSRRAGWPVRPPGRGPPGYIETRDRSGIAEGLPAKVTGDARIALWVVSESQAARLIEALGAAENPRALPAQRSVGRANTPLLPAADTAGAAADTGGTKAESANTKPKAAGAVAQTGQAKAGGGGRPRASSEAPAQDAEAGKAEPEDGGGRNWI